MKPELSESAVAAALQSQWIGRIYKYFSTTGSTNDLLKQAVRSGDANYPPPGTVYLTDFQERGRGRLDRRWEAPPGTSLLFSILFRPDWPVKQQGWLTMLAGLAIAEAIEEQISQPVRLKWPNDILLESGGGWGKVCGILLEGHLPDTHQAGYTILGIGINVNIPADKLPEAITLPTSMLAATGQPVPRLPLLIRLMRILEFHYEQADQGISPQAAWAQRLVTLGKKVEARPFAGPPSLIGLAEGTDEWGRLLVRTADGELHAISAGDVTLRES